MAAFGCVDEADAFLPRPLAEEILRQYADVLRVGQLDVNGAEVKWDTRDASNRSQLHGFCSAFVNSLKRLREAEGLHETVLREAVYCLCKGVSINYALSEVLQLVSKRVGEPCSIGTSGKDGRSLVSYNVELLPSHRLRVRMSWIGNGNIVSCNRTTAKKRVRGTLSLVETEFALPPEPDFVPVYKLQLKLKRAPLQRLVSAIVSPCKGAAPKEECANAEPHRPVPAGKGVGGPTLRRTETMFLDTPLRHSGSPLSIPTKSTVSGESRGTCLTQSTMSCDSYDGTVRFHDQSDDEEEGNDSPRRCVTTEYSDDNLASL